MRRRVLTSQKTGWCRDRKWKLNWQGSEESDTKVTDDWTESGVWGREREQEHWCEKARGVAKGRSREETRQRHTSGGNTPNYFMYIYNCLTNWRRRRLCELGLDGRWLPQRNHYLGFTTSKMLDGDTQGMDTPLTTNHFGVIAKDDSDYFVVHGSNWRSACHHNWG